MMYSYSALDNKTNYEVKEFIFRNINSYSNLINTNMFKTYPLERQNLIKKCIRLYKLEQIKNN